MAHLKRSERIEARTRIKWVDQNQKTISPIRSRSSRPKKLTLKPSKKAFKSVARILDLPSQLITARTHNIRPSDSVSFSGVDDDEDSLSLEPEPQDKARRDRNSVVAVTPIKMTIPQEWVDSSSSSSSSHWSAGSDSSSSSD